MDYSEPVADVRSQAALDAPTGAHLAVRVRAAVRSRATWLQLVQFGVVGASGFVVNLSIYIFCTHVLGIWYIAASILAFCVAVTNNFVLNRLWTFRHKRDDRHAALQGARFLTVSVLALIPNELILFGLVEGAGVDKVVAQVVAVCIVMPISFLGNKLWSFG